MKRIGLMGCGTVARYGHIPTIQATSGLTLAAVYGPVETACRSAVESVMAGRWKGDSKPR